MVLLPTAVLQDMLSMTVSFLHIVYTLSLSFESTSKDCFISLFTVESNIVVENNRKMKTIQKQKQYKKK
jgi:hypothetical protein